MNILQLFPGKVWGGAEQYILDLSSALMKQGHQVYFLSCNSKIVKNRIREKYECTVLPITFPLNLISVFRLAHILRKTSPDIIHIHNIKYVPLVVRSRRLAKSNTKIVLTIHETRTLRISWFFRKYYTDLHKIIFVSALSKSSWIKINRWLPKEKCLTILNSIPVSNNSELEEQTESLRKRYNIGTDIPLLVFIGRVRKSKGCEVLLHALSRLKDLKYHLVYIGRGKPLSYPEYLQKLSEKIGIGDRVSFYGFSTNVQQLLKDADIGVAPSIVRESGSLSVLEFMQTGKCIITTNNGGQPEYIINGETGLLVPANNIQELSNAIRTVLENPQKAHRFALAAQTYFNKHLNYDLFIEKILKIYTD